MTIRRAPYNFQAVQTRAASDALRELAADADRGGIIGVVVGYVTSDRNHRARLAGVCEHDVNLAYRVCGKLARYLEKMD